MPSSFSRIDTSKGKNVVRVIGHCIYCGAKTGLSEEHIFPYGLNGTQVLKDASCQICAGITSSFERIVQRNQLRQVRAGLHMKTRRAKEMPAQFSILVGRDDGSEELTLANEEQPILLLLPIFDTPGLPSRLGSTHGIDTSVNPFMAQVAGPPFEKFMKDLGQTGAKSADFIRDVNPTAFARMIAKIGYAMAVGEFGIDAFLEVSCLKAILGETDDIGNWVGTAFGDEQLLGKQQGGQPFLEWHRASVNVDKNEITARVKLFAFTNAPEYIAILGKPTKELLAGLGVSA